jgi:hypothetical protein
MAEYVLTPEKNEQPSGLHMLEELHRRGFPVEIHVKGEDRKWETIRFSEAGPPEVDCILSYDAESGLYTIFVSPDAPSPAVELQVFVVDALLQELGGRVDNTNTRERFTPEQFAEKIRHHHSPDRKRGDYFWMIFSWVVVVLALIMFFIIVPNLQHLVLVILFLSFVSALLQTYFHFKS